MSGEAVVTSVTVDHIPENLSPNRSRTSAPNHFKVYVSHGLFSVRDCCIIMLCFFNLFYGDFTSKNLPD